MPKAYSENEKQLIKKRLKDEALKCLTQYGVKKTTVDELVKRVNIPKGTFYLFYSSKELLFWDVLNGLHDTIRIKLQEEMQNLNGDLTCDKLSNIIFSFFKIVDETNIIHNLTNGDIDLIMRKLPEEVVQEHLENDNDFIEEIIAFIPNKQNKDLQYFSGAFRAIFLSILHKNEIGEKVYEESLKIMIKGIVMQLFEEGNEND